MMRLGNLRACLVADTVAMLVFLIELFNALKCISGNTFQFFSFGFIGFGLLAASGEKIKSINEQDGW